jgi:hypothetical protein
MASNTIAVWLERNSIGEADLDEMVHEAVMAGSVPALNEEVEPSGQEEVLLSSESRASSINNGGLIEQIEFLVGHFGTEKLAAKAIAGELDLPACFND